MSDNLLDRVFAEAEEYNLTYMTPDEFTPQMLSDSDKDKQSIKKWSGVLRRMEKDGKVTSRMARGESNRWVRAYRMVE